MFLLLSSCLTILSFDCLFTIIFSSTIPLTNKYFDTDTLDNMLIEKIEKSGAIEKFSSNKNLNKMALKAMLLGNNNAYTRLDTDYETLFLPDNISGTKYQYYEQNGKGHLIMTYENKEERTENVGIDFNEEKITHIGEADDLELEQDMQMDYDEGR